MAFQGYPQRLQIRWQGWGRVGQGCARGDQGQACQQQRGPCRRRPPDGGQPPGGEKGFSGHNLSGDKDMAGEARLAIGAGYPVSDIEGQPGRSAWVSRGLLASTGAGRDIGSGAMGGANLNLMANGKIAHEGHIGAVYV